MSLTSSSQSDSQPHASKTISANKNNQKLQLFLGGSCNPTTWRQNVAIPYLEMNGISYYNPQVDDWTPEIVDSERSAKQNAKILLFVIDKQTRSTVSLVESAYMAGENKSLVLVIYPFEYNIVSLTDTSKQSSNRIETSSALMKNKMSLGQNESSSFLETSSSSSSCSSTASSTLISDSSRLGQKSNVTSRATKALSTKTVLTSAKFCSTNSEEKHEVDKKTLELTHEEARVASRTIKMNDEAISLAEYLELRQARYILQTLLAMRKIPMFHDILQALKYISCCLKANEGSSQEQTLGQIPSSCSINESHTSMKPVDHDRTSDKTSRDHLWDLKDNDATKDVYLSFDSDDHASIESTVIPILEEMGLTYNHIAMNNVYMNPNSSDVVPKLPFHPQVPTSDTSNLTRYSSLFGEEVENTKIAVEKEIFAIRSSRVLLFVITNRCRGLSIMVLASHFMALFRQNVVLCVQYLEEPCSIAGENLTKTAIADYNRGRVYLCDYAIKSRVPVFSTIHEAIECCSRKCGHNIKNRT